MKKLVSILTVLLLVAITGCGNNPSENPDPSPTVTVPATVPTDVPATDVPAPTNTPAPTETPVPTAPVVEEVGFKLTADGAQTYEISDILYGLFLEDINHAVDGGMYAEMIKNRSFEYEETYARNGYFHAWNDVGDISHELMDGSTDGSYLNANNPHYLSMTANAPDSGIRNSGWLTGLAIEEGKEYSFTAFLKAPEGNLGNVTIRLQNNSGSKVYGEATISGITDEWWKYEVTITATETLAKRVYLAVLIDEGTLHMDMVSLFPKDTYKGRENGLRADMVQMLADIKPGFLRFPGGCIIEGNTLENAYSWKDSVGNGMKMTINGVETVGDVATRPLGFNLWGQYADANNPYYMTYGFGFYEFFVLCEDLGCEPVPILNCGLSCQAQGDASGPAIGSAAFEQYIQDALDLVEFCRGDASTHWGSVRIAMGHEEPFALTYVGIGNEQWDEIYFERYEEFLAAFRQAAEENPELYGGIELIVSNGPQSENTWAWDKIREHGTGYADLVDEHYYREPDWFLTHAKRYDTYDRDSVPVFLGEYAARSNTLRAALAEAAYMTALERNGDIVHLAAYAPLFSNLTKNHWTPDLIWFNSSTTWASPNYYVQQLFGSMKSDRVVSSTLTGNVHEIEDLTGKIGVGTWQTSAIFDDIKVVSNDTGEVLFSEDFTDASLSDWQTVAGDFSIGNGVMTQSFAGWPSNSVNGDVTYIGDTTWTNYTLTLKATKTGGAEGFLIPFAVQDARNCYHWNIGGWANTVSCLESIVNNVKSGQTDGTVSGFTVETNVTYELKIVVNGSHIDCYIDGVQYVNYDIPQADDLYQVTGLDEAGNIIIKLVNVTDAPIELEIDLMNFGVISYTGEVTTLTGPTLDSTNSATKLNVAPVTSTIDVYENFTYEVPAISVVIIKIPRE
ncbi:MAG: hypothetical protein E7260_09365 [Lachnospiraceae bacterium]|nr:hypothetical protein [Lachnospiraceae bacterium]